MRSLDEFLPDSEFAARYGVAVAAHPDRVDAALREVTFREVPVVRALLFARVVRPFSGLTRVWLLRAAKRRAESA